MPGMRSKTVWRAAANRSSIVVTKDAIWDSKPPRRASSGARCAAVSLCSEGALSIASGACPKDVGLVEDERFASASTA
ncbi:hypothetical protein MTO96_041702 [Rhipicephalus appendiculatus]